MILQIKGPIAIIQYPLCLYLTVSYKTGLIVSQFQILDVVGLTQAYDGSIIDLNKPKFWRREGKKSEKENKLDEQIVQKELT